MKLDESFYQRTDVTRVARELLGKTLYSRVGKHVTSGIIVETEAYSHIEKGCHAYMNRMTKRNEIMFSAGGYVYVYLCYGIHHLFNVVTGDHGNGDAVLVRALEPVDGISVMQKRMSREDARRITSGPGKLTKAMGIDRSFNGKHLSGSDIWIEDSGMRLNSKQIIASELASIMQAREVAELLAPDAAACGSLDDL